MERNLTGRSGHLTRGEMPDAARLAKLLALVQVAWADGVVSHRERELILAVAAIGGLSDDGGSYKWLVHLLKRRPANEVFEDNLKLYRAMLEQVSPEVRARDERALLALCAAVAEASNDGSGFNVEEGNVCHDEWLMLQGIARALGARADRTQED